MWPNAENHCLPIELSIFSDSLSSKLNARSLKRCGFGLKEVDDYDTKYISKIKTIEKYLEFLERKLVPELESKLSHFELTLATTSDLKKKKETFPFA